MTTKEVRRWRCCRRTRSTGRWPATCRRGARRATRSPVEVQAPAFLEGVRLVQHVAQVAEESDHHPDIDIRYTTLTFTLSTHSAVGSPPRTSTSPAGSTGWWQTLGD